MSDVRTIHLVGSYPAQSAEIAMREMLEVARKSPRLPLCISDGETSRFELYVEPIFSGLVEQKMLRVTRLGSWADVRSRTRYAPGRRFGSGMRLGYTQDASRSLPLLLDLRDEYRAPAVALQVGMPTPASISLVALGGKGLLGRWRQPFLDATVAEITEVHHRCGREAVIQLEATAELVAVAAGEGARGPYRILAKRIGASIAAIAGRCATGARFGVHLCLGDLHNRAALRPRSLAAAVCLANAVADHWPASRPLEYIHFPVASGRHPPPTDCRFYRALSQLHLRPETALALGLAHEGQPLPVQQGVVRLAEDALGNRLDAISTACGLGRRSPEVARLLLGRMVELAKS